MTTTDQLRNGIIEELMMISNKEFLKAIFELLRAGQADRSSSTVKLSEEQIVMLKLSEKDILDHKVISQSDLDKADLKWLKGQ